MNKLRQRIQLLFTFLLFVVYGYGQSLPRVEYLDIDNGLPQNTVQSIAKDRFGFMWFGTDNGLCRYDGYSFEYYFNNSDQNQLWDNRILHLNYDGEHYLWVTSQKGLQVLDLNSGRFMNIQEPELSEIFRLDVLETESRGSSVWVITGSHGVYHIINNNGSFEIEGHYWNRGNNPRPITVCAGKEGNIYLGTENGVFEFNEVTKQFEVFELGASQDVPLTIQAIYDDGDLIFFGTVNGLFSFDKQNQQLLWYGEAGERGRVLTHPSVTSLLKARSNELLIGTLGGFCRLDLVNGTIEQLGLFKDKKNNSQIEFIRTLYADKLGNVWIGSEKIGLAHYNIHQRNFKSFDGLGPGFEQLNEDIINSIYKSDEELWVGTAGDGLARINLTEKQIKYFRSNEVGSDFITSISEDHSENLWVGTWGRGVRMLKKGQENRVQSYQSDKGLPSDFISYIYLDQKGQVVVGTQAGLCVFDYDTDRFYSVGPNVNAQESAWGVGCMLQDDKGYFWVGTTNGLHRFNGQLITQGEPTVISKYDQTWYRETEEANSLPNNYVTCLARDNAGQIWVGTYGGGIAKCVETGNGTVEFKKYTQKDGLANNVVYAILCDSRNNLWITTENGLSKLVESEGRFVNYYKQDGLRNNQYYWTAAFRDKPGNIYVGGLNGLNYFHPDSVNGYAIESKPVITALNVYNDKVFPGEKLHGVVPLEKSVFSADTITLSHKDNVFSLEFSGLNYLHSSKIRYAYRLTGVDKDWVEVSAQRRVASYTNLRGGIYHFQLKSTNPEGQYNDMIRELYINIVPPVYQTMWFKVLMVILLLMAVSGYIQYRSFRITIQKKRLEELVKQRTLEIEEKNKQLEENSRRLVENNIQLDKRRARIELQNTQLEEQNKEIINQRDQLIALNKEIENIHQMRMQFFTNISHEFRTPLTLIIAPIERILNVEGTKLAEGLRKSIHTVKRNAERLMLLTNQILTFRKMEAGKLAVELSSGRYDEVLKEIAGAFNDLARDKKIDYKVTVASGDYDGWYDKSKLENIMFNLLSNAFKYTPENEKVELKVEKVDQPGKGACVGITVSDSGQGIQADIIDKVFDRFYRADNIMGFGTGLGLALVKELVNSLNGEISVSSEFGYGASFYLVLPMEQSAYEKYTLVERVAEEPLRLSDKVGLLMNAAGDEDKEDKAAGHKSEIMIVEDNDDLRHFLAESLSDTYKVVTAIDGQEGYEKALKHELDLVISDVMMPRLNGFDLCRQLKNNLNTSHIPVVLLSAKGMEENQIEGMGVGADDYITKPFNLRVLMAKIKTLIENRQKLKKIYLNNSADTEKLEVRSLDDEFMQKVNDVVAMHYADPAFDIETFSSKMYVSRSLLYKKLKALTNVSPNEYINVFRLKKAVPLLRSKNYQVAEVAVMVGFNDPKYFSRVFKKFYQSSPSEYVSTD